MTSPTHLHDPLIREPCVFCGAPWEPNHSASCPARPTKENKVAAAHRYLGIQGDQRNDPLLQDPKVLEYLCKRKKAYIAHNEKFPHTTPSETWLLRGAVLFFWGYGAVALAIFWVIARPRWEDIAIAWKTGKWLLLISVLLYAFEHFFGKPKPPQQPPR